MQISNDSGAARGAPFGNLAQIVVEKVTTNSAINPLLWLCAVVLIFAMPGVIWGREVVAYVCLALIVAAVCAPIAAYFLWMFRDPVRLQSEHYQLEHQRMHLLGDERSPGNIKVIDGQLASNMEAQRTT